MSPRQAASFLGAVLVVTISAAAVGAVFSTAERALPTSGIVSLEYSYTCWWDAGYQCNAPEFSGGSSLDSEFAGWEGSTVATFEGERLGPPEVISVEVTVTSFPGGFFAYAQESVDDGETDRVTVSDVVPGCVSWYGPKVDYMAVDSHHEAFWPQPYGWVVYQTNDVGTCWWSSGPE